MTFNWTNPYPTVRTPVFARNVVATSQPLAAQAGLKMLAAGGNAIDAVIAAASAIALRRNSQRRCCHARPCANCLCIGLAAARR